MMSAERTLRLCSNPAGVQSSTRQESVSISPSPEPLALLSIESILHEFRSFSDADQRRLLKELTGARLAETARRIAANPQGPAPVADEELNRLVHEARREVLRARGL